MGKSMKKCIILCGIYLEIFKYPPGTYYRVESKLYNPCWFMLDQVIISQSMIPLMVKGTIKK